MSSITDTNSSMVDKYLLSFASAKFLKLINIIITSSQFIFEPGNGIVSVLTSSSLLASLSSDYDEMVSRVNSRSKSSDSHSSLKIDSVIKLSSNSSMSSCETDGSLDCKCWTSSLRGMSSSGSSASEDN